MTILLPALYVIVVWFGLNALLFMGLMLQARMKRGPRGTRRPRPRLYVVHTT